MTAKLKLAALVLVCLAGAALYAQQPAQNAPYRAPSYPSRGGGNPATGQDPFGASTGQAGRLDTDQRLADMEKRLEGLIRRTSPC